MSSHRLSRSFSAQASILPVERRLQRWISRIRSQRNIYAASVAGAPDPDVPGYGRNTRRGLFIFSALYTPLFAGAFFGWGPMKLMLEEDGAFASKCKEREGSTEKKGVAPSPSDDICPEQSTALLTLHIYATALFVFSPLLGEISDRFGAPALMNLLGTCGSLGLILLALSASVGVDPLLYPAALLLGVMSVSATIMTVSTGMVFVGRSRARAISALNALLDAGSCVYLALWAVRNATGASLGAIATGYAILAVPCFGGAAYFWGVVVPEQEAGPRRPVPRRVTSHRWHLDMDWGDDFSAAIESDSENVIDKVVSEIDEKGRSFQRMPEIEHETEWNAMGCDDKKQSESTSMGDLEGNEGNKDTANRKPCPDMSTTDPNKMQRKQQTDSETECGDLTDGFERISSSAARGSESAAENEEAPEAHKKKPKALGAPGVVYILIAQRPPLQQLRSCQFLSLAAFFAFHVSKETFTMTVAKDFLASIGDDEVGHRYLVIFTTLMPVSAVGLPFVDQALNRYGFHAALQVVNVLSLMQGIIQVSSDDLNVQVAGFVFFTFFRCFLFAVVFSFVPDFLGANVIGKGAGLLNVSAGLCSFVNVPLAKYAIREGDFFVPNLFYTVLVVPCIIIALFIRRGIQREQRAKGLG